MQDLLGYSSAETSRSYTAPDSTAQVYPTIRSHAPYRSSAAADESMADLSAHGFDELEFEWGPGCEVESIEAELVEDEPEEPEQEAQSIGRLCMLDHDSDEAANAVYDFDATNFANLFPASRLLSHRSPERHLLLGRECHSEPNLTSLSPGDAAPLYSRDPSPTLTFDSDDADSRDEIASSPSNRLSRRLTRSLTDHLALEPDAYSQTPDMDRASRCSTLLWSTLHPPSEPASQRVPLVLPSGSQDVLSLSSSRSLSLSSASPPSERSISPILSSPLACDSPPSSSPPVSPPSPRAKRLKIATRCEPIKLTPIPPTVSAIASARRLAIIASLQRMSLALLQQLVAHAQVTPSDEIPEHDAAKSQASRTRPKLGDIAICVELVRRGGQSAVRNSGDERRDQGVDVRPIAQRRIAFPRKAGKGVEARLGGHELACFMRVVELVLDGLIANVISTKRDLYYSDVPLFRKQQVVDSVLEDLAATLRIRRSDLNVVATSKGLFSGALTLFMKDGSEKRGSMEGTLIPPSLLVDRIETTEIGWVLVVEKDAVFQTLAPLGSASSLSSWKKGVVITGKGYPDVSTRELVKRLADGCPSIPVMFLVDCDPHGLEIMSTYVLGSSALSHDASNLTIGRDRAIWIGLKATSDSSNVSRDDLLLLTPRDRRKALAMLKRPEFPADWKRELEHMLHLNRKAELEAVSSSESTLSRTPVDLDVAPISMSPNSSPLFTFVAAQIEDVLLRKN